MKFLRHFLLSLFLFSQLLAQEYVNITFRHYPTSENVVRAFVPGTFNNWGPNSSGVIAPDAPSLMTYVDSLGFYYKIYRLKVGDTEQYKFHEHYNASGSDWQWLTDPLNPRINHSDNNNSMITIKKAMIFEIKPSDGEIVNTATPVFTAGVFSREFDPIDWGQSYLLIDGKTHIPIANSVISELSILQHQLPHLSNGPHVVSLHIFTQQGQTAADSVRFDVIAGEVYFYTPSCDSIFAPRKTIRWKIQLSGHNLTSGLIKQLDLYPRTFPPRPDEEFTHVADLKPGLNRYVISVTDDSGNVFESDTLKLFYRLSENPEPQISFEKSGGKIILHASASDPQNDDVTFLWANQTTNPVFLSEVENRTEANFEIDIPTTPGDYSIKLTATDSKGNANSIVNFFTVFSADSVLIPSLETVPQWVRDARIYCIFIKGFTADGTIHAAIDSLSHIKRMGFNTIWVLPVMDVEGVVDQGANIGYNIVDFYNVEPFYGTNDDFKQFVQTAHDMGLRVILDVTPNHSSRSHPIALDARSKRKFSRYYDFYQHEIIQHNDNGLGQCISNDGIVYYCGFSDALLNWNWSDDEARQYMLDVYTYWLREFDIDGFRFDVYWGPHRRYGREDFDQPLRQALRAAKADILLLGETQGVGSGTELLYADRNGGVDMAYDWSLKDAIWGFPSISTLNSRLYNAGFRPGPNSFYLRFLENQDEDRVAYRYRSIEKTVPVSTAIFMATGLPLLYQGQEVGMGYGMGGDKDYRVRSTVNWQNPPAKILAPHYQKLTQIRAQFSAFRRQMEDTNGDGNIDSMDKNMQPLLSTTSSVIYAFGRPNRDSNGLVAMNFSSQPVTFDLNIQPANWAEFSGGFSLSETYYLNDLYHDTSQILTGAELEKLTLWLDAYQVAIFTISTKEEHVQLPRLYVSVNEKNFPPAPPSDFRLYPNYPNPFNPTTTIEYDLPQTTHVTVNIFNIQGQKIRTLFSGKQNAGKHLLHWDGLTDSGELPSSGIYFYQIKSSAWTDSRKMLMIR